MKRILTIIPAHNEEATVRNVVAQVRRQFGHEVLVVDDCSSDATGVRAREAGAIVVRLPIQLGAWGATQTGMRYAFQHDFDIVVTMDADGQHHPDTLEGVVEKVRSGETDVAIGSCIRRATALRRFAWSFFRKLGSLDLEDLTSGLRAYSKSAVVTLTGREASLLDYQDIGVLVLLRKHGQRVAEVPVEMSHRCHGRSRVFYSWPRVASYMAQTTLLCAAKISAFPKRFRS